MTTTSPDVREHVTDSHGRYQNRLRNRSTGHLDPDEQSRKNRVVRVFENHPHLVDFLFTPTQSLSGAMGPTSLTRVDLDRDGLPEIAVIDPDSGTLLIISSVSSPWPRTSLFIMYTASTIRS